MTAHTHPVVRAYLARVRTALSDLPSAEIDEIVEDVRPHLAELVDSLGDRASVAAMTEELGEPESYAAEVRAAGEYPPAPNESARAEKPRTALARAVLAGLLAATICAAATGMVLAVDLTGDDALPLLALTIVLVGGAAGYLVVRGTQDLRALPEVRKLAELRGAKNAASRGVRLLQMLNPVWWVVSAALLGLLAVASAVGQSSGILALVILLALAGIALWAGPKAARDLRWVAVVVPLSALVVGSGLGTAGYVLQNVGDDDPYADELHYAYATQNLADDGSPALYYGSRQVENLYVFDSEGKPLTDVYVYGEDGSPVLMPRYACDPHAQTKIQTGKDNKFPRPHIEQGGYDEFGTVNGYNVSRPFCHEIDEVPFTVAVPGGE